MKNIICSIVLLISINSFSQNFKFGKVNEEELKEKLHPIDSSANAAYLYKYRRTYFTYNENDGFVLVTDIHDRIKIYNQEGFDYATKTINRFVDGGTKETIVGLKAYTYNLVNGKVDDIKLKSSGVFENEISKYTKQTKFTMPDVKEGCVIEYKYELRSPFVYNIDEFELQAEIPIKKLVALFEAPEYYNYKSNIKGYLKAIPTKESRSASISFTNKTRTDGGGGLYPTTTQFSQSKVDYQVNISKYDLNNIPALNDEPYVNNINNYRSAVKYELSYRKLPNTTLKYYTTSWEDVITTIYRSENFGGQLNKLNYFKDDIDAMLSGVTDPVQKASMIYNHVKQNVKWNGYYGKYTEVGVKKAYKDHVGNVAEINLMLTAMLRYAGLNANPVLVSTRNNGVPLFPTREGYNYVISAIELPDAVILLDATSKYSSFNLLPYRTLNWKGRIIRENESTTTVNLYPRIKAKTTTFMNATLSEDGEITGKIRNMKTNHDAMSFREAYINRNLDEYIEDLENRYGGIEISEFQVTNDLDLSKPVMVNYNFEAEEQFESIGDKLFISPMFFFTIDENPFKLESREFPVDFGYPSSSKYSINIAIPEGYKVESIPEKVAIQLPDNLGAFKYNIIANETTIQLVVDVDINTSVIAPNYYKSLKEYFKLLVEKEKEKVVLTKA
ncbi:transglutaminase domain-containing protein [uncultured Psychroserpens sp.]|uniref:transglutaminase domain-containing protein n=1 Tax=uncultured Psychroserpens sp. TaxID=255436 RepID=UPI0026394680|nr:transglutaminase domain-containing protein [uncultured Psychroserpens sp.]